MANKLKYGYMAALLVAGSILSTGSALAAGKCYEETTVKSTISCAKDRGSSADFVSGCTVIPPTTEKVEVPCKETWVNITHSVADQTRAQVCATKGMKPTSLDGQICASGERKATGGTGTVNYRFGQTGSTQSGGTKVQDIVVGLKDGGSTLDDAIVYYFCYGSGQKMDNDNTDLVVAYVCK